MTRNQILDRVWNDNPSIDPNILDVYMRYLRLKLEQHHKQRLLHTVRSVGYVLRKPLLKQVPPVKLASSATHSHLLVG
jgi:DNA-binding response OmpR family regulator